MPVKDSPLTKKLGIFVSLSDSDMSVLAGLHRRRRTLPAGHELVHQGQSSHSVYILAKGWISSYKLLSDGTRQIVDFQIPGDILGLRSVLFRTADHCIQTITEVEVSEVEGNELRAAFAETPRLAMAALWGAARDEAMVVEHLVGLGRRSATERTAHLFLELGARLHVVGIGSKAGFDCPLSQYLLADALGLTAVHVNRVLRELRERKPLGFSKGHVEFLDFDGLVDLAGFDSDYLDQHVRLLT
jgi:CRP-like cAMP-binding protein